MDIGCYPVSLSRFMFDPKPIRVCGVIDRGPRFERDRHTSAILEFEICDQYTIQGDLFLEAILEDRPVPTPLEDAVANTTVIDAVFRGAESGQWEPVTLRHRD